MPDLLEIFLYRLVRDEMPAGKVESAVREAERTAKACEDAGMEEFAPPPAAEHLHAHARELATRLRGEEAE